MYDFWSHMWSALLMVVVIVALYFGFHVTYGPHTMEGYYLYQGSNGSLCVAQSIDWSPDSTVYCDTNPQTPILMLQALQGEKHEKVAQ